MDLVSHCYLALEHALRDASHCYSSPAWGNASERIPLKHPLKVDF
jgi:hypothetical protein